ncbi:MAG TPA: ParB/RepB/Spo0J family partition protein [Fimbriimonadales bacterium]|nr:ParB/RepB/Spo0J family partition protein [Fimbriimonadales bacterium]
MRRALGKGLSQLISEQTSDASLNELPLASILRNESQPRKQFDEEALRELADSISRVGVMQPIVVREIAKDRYQIIAGERRWRAAAIAGLRSVPVIIRSAGDIEALELALIENIQRTDISPLECAMAYEALIEEHGLTQEDLARRVGKSRPAIANSLRLLKLPAEIRDALASGTITEGHARAILQFDTPSEQLLAFRRAIERGLSVREIERMAKVRTRAVSAAQKKVEDPLSTALSETLGAPARIVRKPRGGRIEVDYFDEDDLARILDILDVEL